MDSYKDYNYLFITSTYSFNGINLITVNFIIFQINQVILGLYKIIFSLDIIINYYYYYLFQRIHQVRYQLLNSDQIHLKTLNPHFIIHSKLILNYLLIN